MLYLRAGLNAVGNGYYLGRAVAEYGSLNKGVVVQRDIVVECLDQCIYVVRQVGLVRLVGQAVRVVVNTVRKELFGCCIVRAGVDKYVVALAAGDCIASGAAVKHVVERRSDQPVVARTCDKGQGDLVRLPYAVGIVGRTELRSIQRIVARLAVYGHFVAFATDALDNKEAVKLRPGAAA